MSSFVFESYELLECSYHHLERTDMADRLRHFDGRLTVSALSLVSFAVTFRGVVTMMMIAFI